MPPHVPTVEFSITINGKLRHPVERNLKVRLSFSNVDERIQLPREYRPDNSTEGILLSGLRWKTFQLAIK